MIAKFRFVLAAALGAVALVAGSCGVAAPNAAASLDGHDIPASTVDALATDEAFTALVGLQASDSEAVVPGDTARPVLDFLLQEEALWQFAKGKGLDLKPDESLLADTIEGLKQQGYQFAMSDLSPEARDVLSRAVVADRAISGSGGSVDFGDPTDADLRFTYDSLKDSGRWEKTCVTMVAAPPELGKDIVAAVEGGTELAKVPDQVEGSQLAVDAESQCASGADLATLPPELAAAVTDAAVDELVGPLEVSGASQPLSVVFEVSGRETDSFEDANAELTALVGPSLLAVRTARDAEVNPRYGGPVELAVVTGQTAANGQAAPPSLAARVSRPQAPEQDSGVSSGS